MSAPVAVSGGPRSTAPVRTPLPGAPRRTSRGPRWGVLVARLVTLGVILLAWQLAPDSVLPPYAFGRPDGVGDKLWELAQNGDVFVAIKNTLQTLFTAMLLGAPVGIALAAAASTRIGKWLLEPIITVTYGIPKVGLVVLFVIWTGLSRDTHITLVFITVLFLFFFGFRQALDEIDRDKVTAFRLMGASRRKIAWSLTLPGARTHLLAATRLALPLGFGAAVFAELRVPTTKNLGQLLSDYSVRLDGNGAIALVIVIGVVGYLLDLVIGRRLQRYTKSVGSGIPTQ